MAHSATLVWLLKIPALPLSLMLLLCLPQSEPSLPRLLLSFFLLLPLLPLFPLNLHACMPRLLITSLAFVANIPRFIYFPFRLRKI
jgi:hypothetical protein